MIVYVFGGSKDNPNWYCTKSRLSKPYYHNDKETKRLRCIFFAESMDCLGYCHILTLKQLLVLPFKHRLYFSEKRARRQQHKNWLKQQEAETA